KRLKSFAQMLNDELPESVDIFKLSVDELIEKTKEVTGVELELGIAQKLKKEIQDMEKSSEDLDRMIRGFGTAWKVASRQLDTSEQKRQLLELAKAYKEEADRIGEYYRELTESTGKDFSDEQDRELYELHQKTKERVQNLFSDIDLNFPIEKMGQQFINAFNELPKEIQDSLVEMDLGDRVSLLEKVVGGMDGIKEDVSEYRKGLVAQVRMGLLDAKTDIEAKVEEYRIKKIKELLFEDENESVREVKSMLDQIKVDFRSFIDDLIEEGRKAEALEIAPHVREEFKQEMQNIKFQIQDLKEERDKFASGELITEKERAKLREYNLTIKFLEESLVELQRELDTYGNVSVAAWADASKYSLEFKNKLKEIDNTFKEDTPEWYRAVRQLIAEYEPLYQELVRINDKIVLPKEAREALKKFGWSLDKAGDKADKFKIEIMELNEELNNLRKESEYENELARLEQRYVSEQRMFLETYYLKKEYLKQEMEDAKEHYEELKESAEATEKDILEAKKKYLKEKQKHDKHVIKNEKKVSETIANMHVSGATKASDAWAGVVSNVDATFEVFTSGWNRAMAEIESEVTDWSQRITDIVKKAHEEMSDSLTEFVRTGKTDWKDLYNTMMDYITKMMMKWLTFQAMSKLGMVPGGGGGAQSSLSGGAQSLLGGGASSQQGTVEAGEPEVKKKGLLEIITNPIGSLFKGIGNLFGGLFGKIKDIFGGIFGEKGGKIVSTIASGIAGFFTGGASWLGGLLGSGGGALSGILGKLGGLFGGSGGFLSGILGKLGGLFGGSGGFLSGIFDKIGGLFGGGSGGFLSGILGKLGGFFGGVTDNFSGIFGNLLGGMKNIFGGFTDKLGGLFGGMKNTLGDLYGGAKNLLGGFKNTLGDLYGGAKNLFGGMKDTLGDIFNNFTNKTSNTANRAVSGMQNAGSNTVSGVQNAGSSLLGGLKNLFSGLLSGLGSIFKSVGGIASDLISKLYSVVSNLIGSLTNIVSNVVGKLSSIVSNLVGSFTNLIGSLTKNLSSVFSSVTGSISNVFNNFSGKFEGVLSGFTGTFSKVIGSFGDVAKSLVSNIGGAISGAVSGTKGVLSSFFHSGGTVGKTKVPIKILDEDIFKGAKRFHDGLMPNEFPAILEKGETVIPKDTKFGGLQNVKVEMMNDTSMGLNVRDAQISHENGEAKIKVWLDELKSSLKQETVETVEKTIKGYL
ncbi:MAG: phage tail tape measure C-terminal domain-containing protein, partial [archaeon]